MRFLRQMFTIVAKDLRSELRTKEAVNASLSFALVILLLFSFAFDPTSDMTREISGGPLPSSTSEPLRMRTMPNGLLDCRHSSIIWR